jgi:hypothetical protein
MDKEINIPDEVLMNKIYLVREQKVMLDRDLAELYGVETRVLKQAVRRNLNRFPEDFMFEMEPQEFEIWRSQFVTSTSDQRGLRYIAAKNIHPSPNHNNSYIYLHFLIFNYIFRKIS